MYSRIPYSLKRSKLLEGEEGSDLDRDKGGAPKKKKKKKNRNSEVFSRVKSVVVDGGGPRSRKGVGPGPSFQRAAERNSSCEKRVGLAKTTDFSNDRRDGTSCEWDVTHGRAFVLVCVHTWKIEKRFKRIYDDNKNNRWRGRGEVVGWPFERSPSVSLLPIKRAVERATASNRLPCETILGLSVTLKGRLLERIGAIFKISKERICSIDVKKPRIVHPLSLSLFPSRSSRVLGNSLCAVKRSLETARSRGKIIKRRKNGGALSHVYIVDLFFI